MAMHAYEVTHNDGKVQFRDTTEGFVIEFTPGQAQQIGALFITESYKAADMPVPEVFRFVGQP